MPVYDPEVLGQILTLPSGVYALTAPLQIAEFVVAGCRRAPGVASALFCYRGTWLTSEGVGATQPAPGADAFAAARALECPQPCPLATGGMIRFGMRGARLCFDGVLLHVDDLQAFKPYRALLGNAVSHVALLMENRDQGDTIVALNAELERRVTERTKELREKNEELERFFTQDLDLLCIADTDGRLRRLNPRWETTLGYSRDELAEWPFLELVLPEDRAGAVAAMQTLAENQPVRGFVNRYRAKDGSLRWLRWDSYQSGRLIYVLAHDITGRHAAADSPESALRERETILFAEDEPTLRRLGTTILERHGYRVLACGGVEEALTAARNYAGPIDLLMTDFIMPGGNGRLLAEKLLQLRPQLKVLYTSGYTADVLGGTGVPIEGLHFLPKPYSPAELLDRLRQLLARPACAHSPPATGGEAPAKDSGRPRRPSVPWG